MGKNSKSETNDDQVIGVNWYQDVFLKDNPDMVNKLGKGLDCNCATCASHTQLEKWYSDVSLPAFVYRDYLIHFFLACSRDD